MARQTGSSKALTPSSQVDFTVENYGCVFFVRCETESAKKVLVGFGQLDGQWLGDRLAVEPRFIGGLVSSLRREDGWKVE
jgi:hypothetical protein